MKTAATLLLLLSTLALNTEAAVIKPELQDRQQLLNCFTTCVSTLDISFLIIYLQFSASSKFLCFFLR